MDRVPVEQLGDSDLLRELMREDLCDDRATDLEAEAKRRIDKGR